MGLELVGLEKRYGSVAALRPLDLTVDPGEFVALLGPSGCGKTTALRLIAGLEEPTAGEVRIDGRVVNEVEPAARDVAMVFQNYALYPHMTVHDNLAFGLRMRRMQPAEAREKVEWAASLLGVEELLDRRPGELSGGQRQRVALGRALVREPRVFLFDEPLSNLDARLRLEMRTEIAGLHRELGTTMVFVTHDQVEAMTLGQRIAVMRDGRLQQYAPPLDVYRRPSNLFVAGFIGMPPINTVGGDVTVADSASRFRTTDLELDLPLVEYAGVATLGVRPEAVRLVTDGENVDLRTTVARLEPLGSEVLVYFGGPQGEPWVARVDPDVSCVPGDTIGVRLDRRWLHLFAGADGARLAPAAEEGS